VTLCAPIDEYIAASTECQVLSRRQFPEKVKMGCQLCVRSCVWSSSTCDSECRTRKWRTVLSSLMRGARILQFAQAGYLEWRFPVHRVKQPGTTLHHASQPTPNSRFQVLPFNNFFRCPARPFRSPPAAVSQPVKALEPTYHVADMGQAGASVRDVIRPEQGR